MGGLLMPESAWDWFQGLEEMGRRGQNRIRGQKRRMAGRAGAPWSD